MDWANSWRHFLTGVFNSEDLHWAPTDKLFHFSFVLQHDKATDRDKNVTPDCHRLVGVDELDTSVRSLTAYITSSV